MFASATLTVHKSFDFFKNSTGLSLVQEKEIITSTFDSPFEYHNKVLFIVPNDISAPNESNYNDHINDYIAKTVSASGGSTFVLFTSYMQLKKSFETVNPLLREEGLRSFKQGDKSKEALLEAFINETDSTLLLRIVLGRRRAPGDTLRYVILTKLPFRMPTEPLEQARVEDLKAWS